MKTPASIGASGYSASSGSPTSEFLNSTLSISMFSFGLQDLNYAISVRLKVNELLILYN